MNHASLPADDTVSATPLRNLTLLFASSLTVMAGTPVTPALPQIAAAYADQPHSGLMAQLMLTLPGLFIGLLAPASGWLVDRFGRRPLLLWGTVLYVVAGSSGLYLNSLWAILVGRALLGIAVAGIMTAAVTLIGDYFNHAARHRFLGLQGAFMSFGGMLFLLAGGFLSNWSWRGPFGVYLIALVVIPMILVSITEPRREKAVLTSQPQPLPTFSWRVVLVIYLVAFLGMVAFYAVPIQLPFHLLALTGADGTLVGIAIASMTLFSTASAMSYSRLKAHLSFPAVVACMSLGLSVGYLIVAVATTYAVVLMGVMVAGVGLGLLMPNLNVWLMSEAPEAVRGRLVGGLTMALFLGQFVSPIVLRPLLAVGGTIGLFLTLGGMLLAAAGGFAGYASYLWLGRKERKPSGD